MFIKIAENEWVNMGQVENVGLANEGINIIVQFCGEESYLKYSINSPEAKAILKWLDEQSKPKVVNVEAKIHGREDIA